MPLLLAVVALALTPFAPGPLSGTSALHAQENGDRLRAVAARIPDGEAIRIDGFMDESVWALAEVLSDFTQQDPVEGGVPSERTEIRILFDRDALYIGGMFYDDPRGVIAHQRQRNAGLGTDDRFMWILDTFRDGTTGYFFEINPAGLMGDGLISGAMGVNKSWDGIWEVRTQLLEDGWSAEIRIPFSTLNFDPSADRWGINFQRTIRRRNEEIVWSGWRRTQALSRTAHAGELYGLDGISQGVGIEVRPYLVGNANQVGAAPDGWDNAAKAGVDLSYSITPSLRAALSVNTDFAEVEVDQRRVNLTRFPERFPEQRGFFLEGSGVFSFSPASGVTPFFSRRIGLVQGEEVPITYGARLGGQAGAYTLGLFQVRTGETELGVGEQARTLAPEDFTAARVRRSLFEQSYLGVVYTRRATGRAGAEEGLPDRHTVGTDLNLQTSNFRGRYNAQFEAFYVVHTDPVAEGSSTLDDRTSRGIRINFPNDVYRFHVSLREFGTHWDPAVGFSPRNGFRRLQPTYTYAPRPERWGAVRRLEWQVQWEYLTDLERVLQTRDLSLTLLSLNFESGDNLSFEVGDRFERLERTFRIHGAGEEAIFIEMGDYDTQSWQAQLRTAGRRRLSGNVTVSGGDFWNGSRSRMSGGITTRPRPGVTVGTQYERNEVSLPQGDFRTNLTRLSGSWDLSPLTSFTGNLQYDDVSQILGVFARARWIVGAGNDIFLVYTHNWRSLGGSVLDRDLETLSRGGAFKVNYTYRF